MPHTCALQEKCLILPYPSLSFGKDTAIITYLPTLTNLTVMYDIQLNLCIDVIYHDKMKAYGLRNLVNLYGEWAANHPEENTEEGSAEAQD
mgnify:CR=1 FL=1